MLWRGPMGGGAASGKVGAMVASHNAGGQYLRARTTPTNPNTTFQQDVRDGVRTLTTRWNTLTQEQRDGWKVYGSNVAITNRIGNQIAISGIAHYVRSNTPRFQAGLPIIDTAPGTFDLGDVQGSVLSFEFDATTGTLGLSTTADWITSATGSENTMLAYISRPQNPGINFFKGPYRLAGQINSANASTGEFTLTLPFLVTVGLDQQLFGQVRVTRGDARLSGTFQFSGTEGA